MTEARAISEAVKALRLLPGVGRKSATRYVYALLKQGPEAIAGLADAIGRLGKEIETCSVCFDWTENDPCERCATSTSRTIVVVESPTDILPLEQGAHLSGRFHVLQGVLDPLGGVGIGDLTVDQLLARVREEEPEEVLLALSPTREGEATSRLVATLLGELDVRVTRLAFGMPLGTQIEYLDEGTLSLALEYRRNYPESTEP